MLLLAQLTDTHVVATAETGLGGIDRAHPIDNNGRLAKAVASINAESPAMSAVIATGDLVNDARPDEYDALTDLLSPLRVPFLAIPGNHDDRAQVRALCPDLPWVDDDHASWSIDHQGVTIIGLDTTIPGQPGAEFDQTRARWLDAALDTARGPVVLAMHHPPFDSGIGWMDRSGFIGRDHFSEVIGRHRIDRILCGHLHRPMVSQVAGVTAHVGPATVQHVDLDLDPSHGTRPALIDDPVGYLVHRFAKGQWVSHTRYFDTGNEAYEPSWV